MILDQAKKNQCMKEIEEKLPQLLLKANIVLTPKSYLELLEIVKSSIKYEYFSGPTDPDDYGAKFATMSIALLPLTIAFFPLWLALAVNTYNRQLISIPEDCKNRELKSITQNQLDSLESILKGTILVNYRDYVTEARLAKEAEERQQLRADQEAAREQQEAALQKKQAEADKLRSEISIEKIKTNIAKLKTETPNSAKNTGVLLKTPSRTQESVTYYVKATRFLAIESLVEDHDGNPVMRRKSQTYTMSYKI